MSLVLFRTEASASRAAQTKRNRPKTKEEARLRKAEHRAGLAAQQTTPRSLRPDAWLQWECALGDPDAIAIRDAWKFQMPRGTQPSQVEERQAQPSRPLSDDAGTQLFMYARGFGLPRDRGEKAFVAASRVEDEAQDFASAVWIKYITGGYSEEGKLDAWLAHRWRAHRQTSLAKLIDERDNFHGIEFDGASDAKDEEGVEAAYVSEAEVVRNISSVERHNSLVRTYLDHKLAALSPSNRNLCELWLKLGVPTQRELAEAAGVSIRTLQRAMKEMRNQSAEGKVISLTAVAEASACEWLECTREPDEHDHAEADAFFASLFPLAA